MVAHATGWGGGPPPPTRNEAKLQAELRECQANLAAVRDDRAAVLEDRDELAFAVRDLLEWATRSHRRDPSLHPEEFFRTTEHAQRVLDDHASWEAPRHE